VKKRITLKLVQVKGTLITNAEYLGPNLQYASRIAPL
jgi:hypothetical protein